MVQLISKKNSTALHIGKLWTSFLNFSCGGQGYIEATVIAKALFGSFIIWLAFEFSWVGSMNLSDLEPWISYGPLANCGIMGYGIQIQAWQRCSRALWSWIKISLNWNWIPHKVNKQQLDGFVFVQWGESPQPSSDLPESQNSLFYSNIYFVPMCKI